MSHVQVSTVQISNVGVQVLLLDRERAENEKIALRLEREIREKQERLLGLYVRQNEIETAIRQAQDMQISTY